MQDNGVQAYILWNTDPHQSEYLADHYRRIMHLSGFTGSSATVVVTMTEAALWTDSRYYVQAARELDGTLWQMKKLESDEPYYHWAAEKLKAGDKVGLDATLCSVSGYASHTSFFANYSIQLKSIHDNLVDLIWTSQPALPADKAIVHDLTYAIVPVSDKFT